MPRVTLSLAGRTMGLAAIAALQAYWFLQPIPNGPKILTALVLLVAVIRPSWGLIAFAGLAPLSTPIAHLVGGAVQGQLLGQMAISVSAGVLLRDGSAAGRSRIGPPALLMTVVAFASAGAMLIAEATPHFPGIGGPGLHAQDLWNRAAAEASPIWSPLFTALTIGECALLGWAVERTVRMSPRLLPLLVAIALAGHAGAAMLDVYGVLSLALATGNFLDELPRLLASVRVSMQTDVHAAATSFVLAGVAGFGLMHGTWSKRVSVAVLLAMVGVGLWITGSRTAIVLALVAGLATIGWIVAGRARRGRVLVATATALALVAGTWLAGHYPAGRYNTVSGSLEARLVLAGAGIQMFKSEPVFGIGLGQFYPASAAFIGPTKTAIVGYERENAHNNFIQVLAEQGVIGLMAMLWWLGVVLVRAKGSETHSADPMRGALVLAVLACVGTWLTGHPLLVPEFSLVFWFYCGLLVSTTTAPPAHRRRWPLWIMLAAVLISVPLRAQAFRNAVDLEHRGVDLSLWQHDDEQRYREAGRTFALFLPTTGREVEVPVRRAPGSPDPVVVEASLNGQVLATLNVSGEAWHTILVVVPKRARRFERIEFKVRPATTGASVAGAWVRVGRDAAR